MVSLGLNLREKEKERELKITTKQKITKHDTTTSKFLQLKVLRKSLFV